MRNWGLHARGPIAMPDDVTDIHEHTEPDTNPDRGYIVAGYCVVGAIGAIIGSCATFYIMAAVMP